MPDDLSFDIAALARRIDASAAETNADAQAPARARLVVATDWSRGAMPLTALRAFRTLVPSQAPIELVFAVPHAPTPADAACIQILAEEVGGDLGLSGLDVLGFDEVSQQPYDSALVPVADPEENLAALGSFVLRMADLARTHARSDAFALSGATANPGSREALRSRLDAFGS